MQYTLARYDSEEVVQAPLESCIATLLMQETLDETEEAMAKGDFPQIAETE